MAAASSFSVQMSASTRVSARRSPGRPFSSSVWLAVNSAVCRSQLTAEYDHRRVICLAEISGELGERPMGMAGCKRGRIEFVDAAESKSDVLRICRFKSDRRAKPSD